MDEIRHTVTALVDDRDFGVTIDEFNGMTLLHWHHTEPTILPDAFAAIRFQLEGAGWIIRGEPIETEVPPPCLYANDNGLATQRHFLLPAIHEDEATR